FVLSNQTKSHAQGMKRNTFIQFLKYEKRFSAHTIKAYQSDLDQFFQFIERVYGFTDVVDVQHIHVRSWIVDLMQRKMSSRSINRKLSALKTYFKYLLKRQYLSKNPMLKVVGPKTGKRLPVFVHQKQMKQLFDLLDFGQGYSGWRDRMMIETLYSTGMRRSELIGLKDNDVDFTKNHYKVLGKGNKERLIPFSSILARNLEHYLEVRDREFPEGKAMNLFLTDKGKPLYPKMVYNLVKKYLSQITTVEQKSPHVLRHSFATHLSDNGADLNAIKALMGHANLAATQIYTHNSIEKLRKVYQQAHPKAKVKRG
ncbi:MAG: tyrosine-type recombinase/integrase, partial [Bacteroidota bacterium]